MLVFVTSSLNIISIRMAVMFRRSRYGSFSVGDVNFNSNHLALLLPITSETCHRQRANPNHSKKNSARKLPLLYSDNLSFDYLFQYICPSKCLNNKRKKGMNTKLRYHLISLFQSKHNRIGSTSF
jgi:hypothetical protein